MKSACTTANSSSFSRTQRCPASGAVAVDIFGDQDKNVDGSGAGDRAIFERNAAHYAPAAALDILQSSSLDLAGDAFTTRRFRFLSIDGGHTAEVTANDLRLAEQTLIPGGVVALDDILSHHWTGVLTGLAEYLKSGGTLVPFALVPNKLLLAQDAVSASMWLADLERHFPLAVAKRDLEFLGSRIISFDESAYYARADYVAIRRQVSDLEDRLAACEAARQKARADLAQQTDSLQQLDATLAWHEQERVPTRDEFVRLQALWQRRVTDLEGEVSALQSSTSWRVTSPMRMIMRLARRR